MSNIIKMVYFIIIEQAGKLFEIPAHFTYWVSSKGGDYLTGRDYRHGVDGLTGSDEIQGAAKNLLRNYQGIGSIDQNAKGVYGASLALRYGEHTNKAGLVRTGCAFATLQAIQSAGVDLDRPAKSVKVEARPYEPKASKPAKSDKKDAVKGDVKVKGKKTAKEPVGGDSDNGPDSTGLDTLGL